MPLLAFSHRDPRNSQVTDTETGELLFEVDTSLGFVNRTTTLFDAQRCIVAVYEHKPMSGSTVTIRGKEMDLESFCPRKNIIGQSRTFTAPNGTEYEWDHGIKSFKLVEMETEREVGRSESGIFLMGTETTLEVDADLLPILDAVVLSFIIAESHRIDDD